MLRRPPQCGEILPWEVEYKRVSGDRYQIKSTRQFKAEGILVEARWSGYLIVRDESKLPDCAIRFIQEKFQWVNPTKDAKALYQETLRLQTTLL